MKAIKKILSFSLVVMFLAVTVILSADGKDHKDDKNLREIVTKAKEKAADNGMYNCCLKHPCDQCIINMGGCPCGANLAEGKPVCHECKGGWDAGDGLFDNIKPEDVKTMPRGKM